MSEPRIISPLLDGFALGHSMSDHCGVSCYPAMRVDSDERYIVKTISIPATQTRLEALLLTGAYPNAEAARPYFLDLAKGIEEEAAILEKLSQQRGFLPFVSHQTVPMEEGIGYEVYLVSYYRRSLERHLKRAPLTHLSALNMGIDLCAALSVAREAGYLYVDLKPSNIYLSGEQEYHISDLGFVSLDSLKYASLPDRCRSSYTAPEVADAFAQLNTTMDTYALGMVLYQVYNNNELPQLVTGEEIPAPAYADYEMAQIILQAIDPDPEKRWADPNEMGHALIAYMQRNGANDVPIGPTAQSTQEIPVSVEEPESAETEEAVEEEVEDAQEEIVDEDSIDDEAVEEAPAEEDASEEPADDWIDRMDAILSEDSDGAESEEVSDELRRILSDTETEDELANAEELSEDTAGILSQADELIAHEAPEPVVAPEPIDVPIPEPIVLEDEEEITDEEEEESEIESESEEAEAESEEDYDEDEDEDEDEDDDDEDDDRPRGGFFKKLLIWIIVLLLLGGAAAGGYWFVTEYYLQEVESISATGEGDVMTVNVVSEADESLLSVVCVDLYGNKQTMPLVGGSATFSGLAADTQYNLTVEVEGLHRLTGQTAAQFYTLPQANITSFTAITGPEDGSVILAFTGEGPAVSSWNIEYAAAGEEPTSVNFTGTTLTIPGLTPGTEYTFTLVPTENFHLVGQTQVVHTASKVIYAENLSLTGDGASTITASWNAPEGANVTSWTARCYNEAGYDQTLTVNDTTVTFTDVDVTAEHTVEITAEGMTQSTRTYVTANPINITSVTTGDFNTTSVSVTWEYTGTAPEGGWLVLYTVDGSTEQHVIQCAANAAVIDPAAPGCHYDVTIQAANAVSVFGGVASVDIPEASTFSQFGLNASEVTFSLCKAPADEAWDYKDIDEEDITSTFTVGDSAGIMLHTTGKYDIDYNSIPIVFVIRTADGVLYSVDHTDSTWDDLWLKGRCHLSIPALPSAAGEYSLSLYINGQLMTTQNFTMQ